MPTILPSHNTWFDRGTRIEPVYTITDREFNAVRELIYREAGISLSDAKRALVCSRLARRLRHLGLQTHADYLDYLETQDPKGIERQQMINCLTTNKTDFFREPHHFDFLRDRVFPQVKRRAEKGRPRRLRIWSAGCSMGDEPYTIAITILEHFGLLRGWDVRILATDINTEVLQTAEQGIYPLDRIAHLDLEIQSRYFLRGTGRWDGSCQVRPEVQSLIRFRQLNFMDDPWPIQTPFDVIFCRNVIIYFDGATQRRLLPRFADQLTEQGHLFLGHSENLHWLSERFVPLGNTVYQRSDTTTGSTGAQTGRRVPATRLIAPREQARREIVAGEFFATREPAEISTVLGSCVAVCLIDPVTHVGGMNHFMLPFHTTDRSISARYGMHAMELLINEIMKLGGDRRRLRAKVFGGGNVLRFKDSPQSVGQRNIDFARQFLAMEGIPILAERVGGEEPLRVHFFTDTGRALVKPLGDSGRIALREKQYSQLAAQQIEHPSRENVTLF